MLERFEQQETDFITNMEGINVGQFQIIEPAFTVHACNTSSLETETGGLQILRQSGVYGEF